MIDDDLNSEVLFNERLAVVASSQSKWAGRRKISFDELLGEPWTIPPHIDRALRAAGLPVPFSAVPSPSVSVSLHLVAAGRFLAIFPESMVRFGPNGLPLKVLPIDLPVQNTAVVLVTVKNRTLSPVAKLFIDRARAMIQTLQSRKQLGQRPP